MKILLLSSYDAQSHRYWREGLVGTFPEFNWHVLTLPARYFSWRIRGNSLTFAYRHRQTLSESYDLVIATSMTDLATLRGLCPSLCAIPTLVYFHENQFAYPDTEHAHKSVEPQILNLYTALSGDRIAFNSEYNYNSFLAGAKTLLRKMPDHAPLHCLDQIERRGEICPVPLVDTSFAKAPDRQASEREEALQIVWNHRWEYDKGPHILLECVRQLLQLDTEFRMHIVGQQFRKTPDEFDEISKLIGERLGYWGYINDPQEYRRLLLRSDLVLSTALHDFQGIAVLEAVAAGCIPLVPDRLAYTSLFDKRFRYPSTLQQTGNKWHVDPAKEGGAIAQKIGEYVALHSCHRLPDPPNVKDLGWANMKATYLSLIEQTIAAHREQFQP